MHAQPLSDDAILAALSKNPEMDISRLEWTNLIYIVFVYAHFALGVFGFVPLWTFCIGAPMYVARWMIGLHEILHLLKPQDINPLIRLHLLIVTPFSLGYREVRDIHMRHHAYTVTDKDPDLYHIKGNFFTSFLTVLIQPEISAYHWVREKGFDRELALGMTLRFVLFTVFTISLGWTALWYFIPVRLAYGSCMFSISFPLHRQSGEYGTYTPKYGLFLETIMDVFFGRAALNTLSYHDIHHDYPRISAFKLPVARKYYRPKPSSLADRSSISEMSDIRKTA